MTSKKLNPEPLTIDPCSKIWQDHLGCFLFRIMMDYLRTMALKKWMAAIQKGDLESLKAEGSMWPVEFYKAPSFIQAIQDLEHNPISTAIEHERWGVLKWLWEHWCTDEPSRLVFLQKKTAGRLPIHFMHRPSMTFSSGSMQDYQSHLDFLIHMGFSLDAQTDSGATLLHLLCDQLSLQDSHLLTHEIEILITSGASLCIEDQYQNRPLDLLRADQSSLKDHFESLFSTHEKTILNQLMREQNHPKQPSSKI